MADSKRKIFDCRNYPSETHRSVAISGTEEVLDEAVHHATTRHGKEANPHLRDQLRLMLEDEK